MELKWEIRQLNVIPEHNGKKDVVYSVVWMLIAEDGAFSAAHQGVIKTNTDDLDQFIEYEKLSRDQVIQWVIDSLSDEEKQKAQDTVLAQLNAQKNSSGIKSSTTLPWANKQ